MKTDLNTSPYEFTPAMVPKNHTFLGYRGCAKIDVVKNAFGKEVYKRDPSIPGSRQLGEGLYVTSDISIAVDYAKSKALDYVASKFADSPARDAFLKLRAQASSLFKSCGNDQEAYVNDQAEREFSKSKWTAFARVDAVFVPNDILSGNKGYIREVQCDPDRVRSPYNTEAYMRAKWDERIKSYISTKWLTDQKKIKKFGIRSLHKESTQLMIFPEAMSKLYLVPVPIHVEVECDVAIHPIKRR